MQSSALKRFARGKTASLVYITCAILLVFYILNRSYLSGNNLIGIMVDISLSGTLAVGIVGLLIAGHVDLAAGTEGCIAGVVVALLMGAGMAWLPALLVTLALGCVMGLINAFFVNVMGFMAFIVTIAMSSVYKGLALVLANGANVSISNQSFYALGSSSLWVFPLPFIVMIALFVIYSVVLQRTKFGRSVYLCGGNRNAARLAGIDLKRVSTILFVNCGAISSLAGVIFASRIHMGSPNSVGGTEMKSIAASVLGGVSFMGGSGGLGGALVGLILINCFNNGLQAAGLQAYWQTAALGLILVVALLVDYFSEQARLRSLKAS
jgi:ribose transport system permease protein